MSGFSPTDRAVVSWVTVLCVSPAVSREHGRALVELRGLADKIDRMEAGAMHALNWAAIELARCWTPGEPIPFRCIDYCRLALLDFHMSRLPAAKGA